MTIRILVADDEPLARDELIYLLKKIKDVEIVGEAGNGEEALQKIKESSPDAVFLDIQMPRMDGLTVAGELIKEKNPPMIIFATAFDRHAIKAFEVNAVDYVLKPFEEERVNMTISRIRNGLNRIDPESITRMLTEVLREGAFPPKPRISKIAVQEEDRLFFLDPDDIVYITREGRDVFVQTREHRFASKYSLHVLEEKLKEYPFYRTHRAYLVNLNHVEQMVPWFNGSYTLIMKDNNRSKVPVSRLFVKPLKEVLGII